VDVANSRNAQGDGIQQQRRSELWLPREAEYNQQAQGSPQAHRGHSGSVLEGRSTVRNLWVSSVLEPLPEQR